MDHIPLKEARKQVDDCRVSKAAQVLVLCFDLLLVLGLVAAGRLPTLPTQQRQKQQWTAAVRTRETS